MADDIDAQHKESTENIEVPPIPKETAGAVAGAALGSMMGPAGAVQEVMLMQDKFTGKSRGFAFVTMGSEQDAQKAIAEINGKTLEGRALTVNEARPREPRPPGGGGYGGDRRRNGGGQRRGR